MLIDRLISKTRTLANTLRGMAEMGIADRCLYDQILRQVLENDAEIYGTWTVWEPGAMDGNDRQYRNRPGHDHSGRYLPSWVREGDVVRVEPNTNYSVAGLGDYYQVPRRTRSERSVRFSEYIPLSGKRQFFTCHIVPLTRADRFVGVVGIDVLPDRIEEKPLRSASASGALSAREREVLEWVGAGKTNAEIAIILGVSPHTIKHHVSKILEKLGVENRMAAMRTHLSSLPQCIE